MMQSTLAGGAEVWFSTRTDQGRVRLNNEDRVAVDAESGLAIVADGVGGSAAGEEASGIAVRMIQERVQQRLRALGGESLAVSVLAQSDCDLVLRSALVDAHRAIVDEAARTTVLRGMATTVTALLVHGDTAHLCWAGDSPAFLLRNGTLQRINREQNLGSLLGRKQTGANARLLVSVLGDPSEPLQLEIETRPIQDGDLLLLCTDGLTSMVDDRKIKSILDDAKSLDEKSRALIDLALAAGGEDNVSVVLASVTKAGRSAPNEAIALPAAAVADKRWSVGALGATGMTAAAACVSAALGFGAGYWVYFNDSGPMREQVAALQQQASRAASDLDNLRARASALEKDLRTAGERAAAELEACMQKPPVRVEVPVDSCKKYVPVRKGTTGSGQRNGGTTTKESP